MGKEEKHKYKEAAKRGKYSCKFIPFRQGEILE
jgi:hypothetical protein